MNMVSTNLRGGAQAIDVPTRGVVAHTENMPVIRQYLRIAARWRYVILGTTAVCVIVGLIATLLMTPKYTAEVTVEISREADRVTQFQGVDREENVADQEFYQTQYGLLQARSLAERVATQLRLVDDPKFFELFDASTSNPAFELVNGRYAASGRAERQRVAGEVLLKHPLHQPRS
jgi:polysaccharide biosynthesis transport protein